MDQKIPKRKFELDQLVYCIGDGESLYQIWRLTDTSAFLITTVEHGVDGGWESLHKLMTLDEYTKFYE